MCHLLKTTRTLRHDICVGGENTGQPLKAARVSPISYHARTAFQACQISAKLPAEGRCMFRYHMICVLICLAGCSREMGPEPVVASPSPYAKCEQLERERAECLRDWNDLIALEPSTTTGSEHHPAPQAEPPTSSEVRINPETFRYEPVHPTPAPKPKPPPTDYEKYREQRDRELADYDKQIDAERERVHKELAKELKPYLKAKIEARSKARQAEMSQ